MSKFKVLSVIFGVIVSVACLLAFALLPMSLHDVRDVARWKFSKYCQERNVCQDYDGPHLKGSNDGSATFFWESGDASRPDILVTVFARGGKANLYFE
jgi:hypothetical protein